MSASCQACPAQRREAGEHGAVDRPDGQAERDHGDSGKRHAGDGVDLGDLLIEASVPKVAVTIWRLSQMLTAASDGGRRGDAERAGRQGARDGRLAQQRVERMALARVVIAPTVWANSGRRNGRRIRTEPASSACTGTARPCP